jgi:hypothetical protein
MYINSTCILDKTCNSDIGSIRTITCSTIFKPTNVINLTSWYDQTNVGTIMVPIENSPCYVANIKPSFLSNIP